MVESIGNEIKLFITKKLGVAMKILTSQQMKTIDNRAIDELGIIGPILMENAGLQVVLEIRDRFEYLMEEDIVVVAGKGNNGGDGLVVARHLYNQGCRIQVLLLAARDSLRGDAALNAKIAANIGVPVTEVTTEKEWKKVRGKLSRCSVLVDAVFGTGLIKPAQDLFKKVIEDINVSNAFIVAVDIPSGLSTDTYQLIGPCVKADLTVTLAAPKVAHLFPPAEEMMGEVVVADIGIPPFLFQSDEFKLQLVLHDSIASSFSEREKDTHKGTYGHLLILSGSLGKTGAAILAGKAALKTGAGLVTVGTPRSCLPIVARGMAELMTEPLPETSAKTFSDEAVDQTLILLDGKDALLLGPGISTQESTAAFVLSLLPQVKVPVVLDADALNIVSTKLEVLEYLKSPAVLTPHPGEFARLLGCSVRDVIEKKLEMAPLFAQRYGVYLVLKGYRTITATPDGSVFVNPTGNPGMATAGTGDVLSGVLASMIIQDKDFLASILAAVYVHGFCGDLAAQKLGEKSMTASDIIRCLPAAVKHLGQRGEDKKN